MRCLSAGWRAARPPRRGATSAVFALIISFLLLLLLLLFLVLILSRILIFIILFLFLILVHSSPIPCFIVITL